MNSSAPMSSGSEIPPTAIPVLPALDNTFGALLIGVVIACALWGIGTAQAYWYYIAYPRDGLPLKLLVALMWMLDTVHQALITYTLYFYVITNYFNPLNLDFAIWSLTIQSIFEFIPCLCVQSFFLMRIWILSHGNWLFIGLPALFIVAKLILSIIWTVKCSALKSVTQGLVQEHSVSAGINGAAAGGDILLAVTMVILLRKSRTGITTSDTILEKLMIYTINTGVITSLASIVTLITAEVWKRAFIYAIFYFCTGRLYVNTMLASLNARNALKSSRQSDGKVIEMANKFKLASTGNNIGTETTSTTFAFSRQTGDAGMKYEAQILVEDDPTEAV